MRFGADALAPTDSASKLTPETAFATAAGRCRAALAPGDTHRVPPLLRLLRALRPDDADAPGNAEQPADRRSRRRRDGDRAGCVGLGGEAHPRYQSRDPDRSQRQRGHHDRLGANIHAAGALDRRDGGMVRDGSRQAAPSALVRLVSAVHPIRARHDVSVLWPPESDAASDGDPLPDEAGRAVRQLFADGRVVVFDRRLARVSRSSSASRKRRPALCCSCREPRSSAR